MATNSSSEFLVWVQEDVPIFLTYLVSEISLVCEMILLLSIPDETVPSVEVKGI